MPPRKKAPAKASHDPSVVLDTAGDVVGILAEFWRVIEPMLIPLFDVDPEKRRARVEQRIKRIRARAVIVRADGYQLEAENRGRLGRRKLARADRLEDRADDLEDELEIGGG